MPWFQSPDSLEGLLLNMDVNKNKLKWWTDFIGQTLSSAIEGFNKIGPSLLNKMCLPSNSLKRIKLELFQNVNDVLLQQLQYRELKKSFITFNSSYV